MLSTIWKTLFFNPFLNILLILYAVLGGNLGLAVIVLAIITRLMLLGSTRKQMEMTQKMGSLRPKLAELQKKYKNNQEKLAAEQMKLYKNVGYNPIGCVGSFLPQLFILAAIFGVIRTITEGNFDGLYAPVREFVFGDGKEVLVHLKFLIWDLTKSFNSFENVSLLAPERLPYLFLGVLVGAVQIVSTKFMQGVQQGVSMKPKKNAKPNKDEAMSPDEMQAQMTKSMSIMFPLLTAYITLSQPAVLGIYWFAQSVMMVVQYFIIDKEKSMSVLKELDPRMMLNLKRNDDGRKE